MEKRRLGRTGHNSTVAIFGAAALSNVTQETADVALETAIAAGVNHIDIAPSYGEAELRVGPWMPRERERFFLGCKTTERSREGAAAEMHRSLARLQVAAFDLYQLHAVTSFAELDACTAPGGALEAFIEARDQGLTRWIGITGHGNEAPAVFLEALARFDFDTVMFPLNPVQLGIPEFRKNAEKLIESCRKRDVGLMVIKAITKQPWGNREHTYDTWYEPFVDQAAIQNGVDFALSHDVSGLCTSGDVRILPKFLAACESFSPMTREDREALIEAQSTYESIFN